MEVLVKASCEEVNGLSLTLPCRHSWPHTGTESETSLLPFPLCNILCVAVLRKTVHELGTLASSSTAKVFGISLDLFGDTASSPPYKFEDSCTTERGFLFRHQ